jgi:tetratricopeptide (TPR) repeat protein
MMKPGHSEGRNFQESRASMGNLLKMSWLLALVAAAGCSQPGDEEKLPPVRLLQTSTDADAMLRRARDLWERNQPVEAAAVCDECARQYADTDAGYEAGFRAAVYLFIAKRPEEAEAKLLAADERLTFRTVSRVHAAAGDAFYLAALHHMDRARKAPDEKDPQDKTVEYSRRSIGHDPSGPSAPWAMYFTAQIDFRRRKYDKAAEGLERIMKKFPTSNVRANAQQLYALTKVAQSPESPQRDPVRIAEALEILRKAQGEVAWITDPAQKEQVARAIQDTQTEVSEEEAARLMEMADIYRRYGNPRAAYMYYTLLARKYPNSKYSATAADAAKRMPLSDADRAAADRLLGPAN